MIISSIGRSQPVPHAGQTQGGYMSQSRDYNVVFEYIREDGWKGIRYISIYEDENDFNARPNQRYEEKNEKVIAKGIPIDEAQSLVAQVPFQCKVKCSIEKAFLGNKFVPIMFQMEIQNQIGNEPGQFKESMGAVPGTLTFINPEEIEESLLQSGKMKDLLFLCVDKATDTENNKFYWDALVHNLEILRMATGLTILID